MVLEFRLCSVDENSEVFVGHQQRVGEGKVGGGAGPTTLAEPAGDGRSLIRETIFR